jgi:phenylpyruvate tautomerase PptA (4-oxalocrotonate tautomerase family)
METTMTAQTGRKLNMPYLQLDTPFKHTTEQKRRLAKRLGEIYSTKMTSNINCLSVAIRELGEGGPVAVRGRRR